MGLFDRFSKNSEVTLTPKAALALAAITMIAADGSIEDEEVDAVKRIVRYDNESLSSALKVWKAKSVPECVELVGSSLSEDQKMTTVANLLDIAMADGVLAGAEKNLMMSYIDSFGLSEEDVKPVVDVITTKNDFSVF